MRGITIDWSLIDWKWVFTTTLAVYAAVLATYRDVVSRGQWTPKLKVRLSMSIVAIYPEGTIPQFQIWIENHGRCDILFNSNSVSIGIQGSETALLEALRRMPGAGTSDRDSGVGTRRNRAAVLFRVGGRAAGGGCTADAPAMNSTYARASTLGDLLLSARPDGRRIAGRTFQ